MKYVLLAVAVVAASLPVRAADPCQVARLLAPGPFEADDFGSSIAFQGEHWFIADQKAYSLCSGSPFSCSAGAVYVYQKIDGQLMHIETLVSPVAQVADNFGFSIATDDRFLVVGAPNSGSPGRTDRPGAVFVYTNDGEQWDLAYIIEPPREVWRDFGRLVALHDGTLAALDKVNDRVLVYLLDETGYRLTDELARPPGVSDDAAFGWSMTAAEARIIVGAPRDRSRVPVGGSFHVFAALGEGRYELEQSVFSTERQQLGTAVALHGDELWVGASSADRTIENQGVAYQYRFDGSQWQRHQEVRSSQPGRNWAFGSNIAFDGQKLLVAERGGLAVHVFERSLAGPWTHAARLRAETPGAPVQFGFALALQGTDLLVGAPDEVDFGGWPPYGAAYLFDLACDDCTPDLDADGALTVFDYLTFLNLFDAGSSEADFDGDGELTVLDFLAFQTAFDAGCA